MKHDKTIVHVINLDTVGGVEELFFHFLEELPPQSACKHHILIPGGKAHPFFDQVIKTKAASCDYEKYFLGLKIPKVLSFLRAFKRKQVITKYKPDVIVLWNRLEKIESFRKNAPTHCQIIYYEHGASWIEAQKNEDFSPAEIFQKVNSILVNSYAAKRVVELKWQPSKNALVIENPIRPDVLPAVEPKAGITLTQNVHLGFIGRLISLKGPTLLLHVVAILKKRGINCTLSIAGDGAFRNKLQSDCTTLNIQDNVHFLGCIRNVTAFYDSIDMLIIPSIREPLGLVAQEASLRGCPVICTKVDGLCEVVVDGTTGFCIAPTLPITKYEEFGGSQEKLPSLVFDPESNSLQAPKFLDPTTIADRIQYLVEHPDEYRRFSKNAISFAKTRPNFKEYTKTLLKLLTLEV